MIRYIACFVLLLPAASLPAQAEQPDQVTLTTLDGALSVEGELVSFDGELFRVETAFGLVTLEGGNVVCDGPGCPDPESMVTRLAITGPPSLLRELVAPLVSGFAKQQGYVFEDVFLADDHFRWLLTDRHSRRLIAEIEAVGPELVSAVEPPIELKVGHSEAQSPWRSDVIALDALVAIVAPDNPAASIDTGILRKILEGQKLNSVDEEFVPDVVHFPDLRLDLHQGLSRLWPVTPKMDISTAWHDDLNNLADKVASDQNALGLTLYSRIGNSVPLILSGPCGRGMPAMYSSIKAKDYPLTQFVFLHRRGGRQPHVIREFVAYARSNQAQPIVRRSGFVDQAIGNIAFAEQGERIAHSVLEAGDDVDAMSEMRRMLRSLATGVRLTLTFRFRDGSSELDEQSRSNIRRLADAIDDGEFNGKELLFVGFSDGPGERDANLQLSLRRAKSVYNAVADIAGNSPVKYATDAFGEAMPMACDEVQWGREVNRRVEVWVRAARNQKN
ncbi:MAG: OmpA family protein [Boseongicola sp.]